MARVRYLLFAALVLTYSSALFANEIVLTNVKGNITIKGKLIGYNGKTYIIQSSRFGKMRFNSNEYSCTRGACPVRSVTLRTGVPLNINTFGIYGSDTIGGELFPALIDAHAKSIGASTTRIYSRNPHRMRIDIQDTLGLKLAAIKINSTGSAASFPALISGEAQIGMSTRPIAHREIRSMARAGIVGMNSPRQEHILALDGLQIILSPKNKINALSIKQVAEIFSGKIRSWSEVGGPKEKINLYITGDMSGLSNVFQKFVLKPHKVKMYGEAKVFTSQSNLADAVAKDPYGIGFTSIAHKRNTKPVAISTACSAAKFPSIFDIKTEEYPLSFRHYLYTTGRRKTPYAKKLLRYALSTKAQKIVRKYGFINQIPSTLSFSKQADRIITGVAATHQAYNVTLIDQFNKTFKNARRLSVTFRFRGSSLELDNKSRRDARMLARILSSRKFAKKDVFLVGFTDSIGATDRNISRSFKQVYKVRSAIIAASKGKIKPYRMKVRGYGELLPVGCNNTKSGRFKNRRVEVWLR